jgi:hypothetical protein
MSCSPALFAHERAPRFRVSDTTLAVLQFQNGRCVAGDLHVISHNGGLLLLTEAVRQGSVVQLMFHTHRGTVLGTAEMLKPMAGTQQPFRFVSLPENDRRTLHAAFQSRIYRNTDVEERIEELRAAVAHGIARWNPYPWHRRFSRKLVIGLIMLTGCVVCGLYLRFLAQ